jgi:hypothetical protein
MDVTGAEDLFYHDLPVDEAKAWAMKHDTQSSGYVAYRFLTYGSADIRSLKQFSMLMQWSNQFI